MATRSMPTVSYFSIRHGDLELAADAVGAGDEDRVLVARLKSQAVRVEVEEAGEPADALAALARRERRRDHARRVLRAAQVLLDAGDRLLVLARGRARPSCSPTARAWACVSVLPVLEQLDRGERGAELLDQRRVRRDAQATGLFDSGDEAGIVDGDVELQREIEGASGVTAVMTEMRGIG